jgi:hypothetical protein
MLYSVERVDRAIGGLLITDRLGIWMLVFIAEHVCHKREVPVVFTSINWATYPLNSRRQSWRIRCSNFDGSTDDQSWHNLPLLFREKGLRKIKFEELLWIRNGVAYTFSLEDGEVLNRYGKNSNSDDYIITRPVATYTRWQGGTGIQKTRYRPDFLFSELGVRLTN